MGERFGDRVEHWVPVNEPNVAPSSATSIGMHAPGSSLLFDALPVAHHLLLAHGRAAHALRASGAARGSGIAANNHALIWPASDDAADVAQPKLFDRCGTGCSPSRCCSAANPLDSCRGAADSCHDGDLATIRQPLDFYGVNYYNPMRVAAATDEDVRDARSSSVSVLGYPTTDFGWPVVPDALREWLIMLRARYRAALPPI